MDVFNIFNGPTDIPPDPNAPSGYACSVTQVGPKLNAARIGMSVYELVGCANPSGVRERLGAESHP